MTTKSGHAAMVEWDKTWRIHHFPMWIKKALRTRHDYKILNAEISRELLDHWGSVKRGGNYVFITQPYGERDAIASRFAQELGCDFKSFTPGPWSGGTWLYEFYPPVDMSS